MIGCILQLLHAPISSPISALASLLMWMNAPAAIMNTPFAHVMLFCPGHAFISSIRCCVDNLIGVQICSPFVASVAWLLFSEFACFFRYSIHIYIYIRYAYLFSHLIHECPTLGSVTSHFLTWHPEEDQGTFHGTSLTGPFTPWIMYYFSWHPKEIKSYVFLHQFNKQTTMYF